MMRRSTVELKSDISGIQTLVQCIKPKNRHSSNLHTALSVCKVHWRVKTLDIWDVCSTQFGRYYIAQQRSMVSTIGVHCN